MYTLYYSPPSSSFSSSLKVFSDSVTPPLVSTFNNVTLEISASAYETFDSSSTFSSTTDTLRVYVKRSSSILLDLPLNETVIYYSQSFYPSSPSTSSTFNVTYNFEPDTANVTPNNKFIILSGSVSSSISSQSKDIRSLPLDINTDYTVVLSGSGDFYASDLIIYERKTNTLVSYTLASSSPISASLSSSIINADYLITAKTYQLPLIRVSFSS